VIEALPQEARVVLGGLVCLALPFFVGWMLWSLAQSARGVARGLSGGSAPACQALGLEVKRAEPLSGEATGQHADWPVRVSWRVGPEHGFAEHQQKTWVQAPLQPPLSAGLEAGPGLTAPSPPWPELQGLGAGARDPAAARAALRRAAPALADALAGPGQVVLDDASVTLELAGIETDPDALRAALQAAVALARGLSPR